MTGSELDFTARSNLDTMLEQYEHRDTEDDDTFFEKNRLSSKSCKEEEEVTHDF